MLGVILSLVTSSLLAAQTADVGSLGSRSTAASSCPTLTFTALHSLLTVTGTPVYVEVPAATRLRGGLALVGEPSFLWATSESLPTAARTLERFPGVILGPRGVVPISYPPGHYRMRVPRLASAPDSAMHVVWATTPGAQPIFDEKELWHATYNGTIWSPPTRIAQVDRIAWNQSGMEQVGAEVRVAAPVGRTVDGARQTGILYAALRAGRWQSSWIQTGSFVPGYVALTRQGDGAPLVAFIGALRLTPDSTIQGVFVVKAHGWGATWEPPRLVYPVTPDTGGWLVSLARTPDGQLHLMWADTYGGSAISQSVSHRVSSDDGRTWRLASSLNTSPGVSDFKTTALPTGQLLVLVQNAIDGRVRLATWHQGRWTGPSDPLASRIYSHSLPSLSFVAPSTLYLFWGKAQRLTAQGDGWPRLYTATTSLDCPIPRRIPEIR